MIINFAMEHLLASSDDDVHRNILFFSAKHNSRFP